MSDSELLRLGAEFDQMLAAEDAANDADGEYPEEIDVPGVVWRIGRVRARTPVGLAVQAKALEYAVQNWLDGHEQMTVRFLRDLRRLGVLPPASGQVVPLVRSDRVARMAEPEHVLRLAA
jgi:hypothetical protein